MEIRGGLLLLYSWGPPGLPTQADSNTFPKATWGLRLQLDRPLTAPSSPGEVEAGEGQTLDPGVARVPPGLEAAGWGGAEVIQSPSRQERCPGRMRFLCSAP